MTEQDLRANNDFISAIEAATSEEEFNAVLKRFGAEDLAAQFENMPFVETEGAAAEELSEEALETVAGGGLISWLGQVLYRIKYGKKATCTYSPINGMQCTPR